MTSKFDATTLLYIGSFGKNWKSYLVMDPIHKASKNSSKKAINMIRKHKIGILCHEFIIMLSITSHKKGYEFPPPA